MSDEIIFNDSVIDETITKIRTGEIVEGTVIQVKPDSITLNVGYKYDGIITKEEFSAEPVDDLTGEVNVGDVLEAKVLKISDSTVSMSIKRLGKDKIDKKVAEAFESGEPLPVKIESKTKGGLIASYQGSSRIFIPSSLATEGFERDLSQYVGQEFDVIITEFDPKKHRIIGNRKTILKSERKEKEKALLAVLQEGDVVEGTVRSLTSFGAFIDLNGIDGLLHISEMSWGRIDDPKKLLKVGDKIDVYIKKIENGKIALSAKFPDQNPWLSAREKYAPGVIVTGKIARITDFGAFVELEPGIDALLHVSQISRKRIKKPSSILKVGQVVDAKIVDFKEDERKISLSRRDFADDLVPDDFVEEDDEKEADAKSEGVEAAQEEEAASEAALDAAQTTETPVEEAAAEEVPAEEEVPVEEAPAEEAASLEEEAQAAEEAPTDEAAPAEAPAEEEAQAEEAPIDEAVPAEAPAEEEAQAEE